MRMRCLGPLLIGLVLFPEPASAQDRRFPYDAVVDADEEFVRSGPGPKYYPTGKLSRGEKIAVHRHDPGGWYMIAPPSNSFSWIQAEYVQRIDNQRGRLTANNVIVHVGSTLADERSVYQRTLSKGDSVEILEEAQVTGERGPVALYKIKPPAREYRWIAGKSVVPSERYRGQPPPKFKPNLQPAPSINGPVALEVDPNDDAFAPSPFQPQLGEQPGLTTGEHAPKDASVESSLEAQREELRALDQKLRETLAQEPANWNLASLEQAYQTLEQAASDEPTVRSSVQQRLRTLQKYAKIQQDYTEFHRLTTETKQRDAQLATMQKQIDPTHAGPYGAVPLGPTLAPVPDSPPHVPAAPASRPPGLKFDGAGIIERAASPPPGAPPFVLVAPDGRLLSYLQPPPGLDLNRHLRQSMGIYGERTRREEWQSDLIVIRGMQPVRLRTAP
jgi:uncharacterized protein YgiM (DUF1202 family)